MKIQNLLYITGLLLAMTSGSPLYGQNPTVDISDTTVNYDDLRRIAEGNPSIFWRMADQTHLEMSEDGGATFRPVTIMSEKPSLLTTRADNPRSVFVHYPTSVVEVNDEGVMISVHKPEGDVVSAGDEPLIVEGSRNSGVRAAAAIKCTYTVSDRIIHLGVASGTTSMSIRGTCPWTVVTEDRAFARSYNAATGSPIILPNKNLSIATQVLIEFSANLSINARGTVLLVLDVEGRVVGSTVVIQHGYNRGRSSDAVPNPTAEVRLTAQAQSFEAKFLANCRTCEFPRKPVSWISRVGDIPERAPAGPITLGFQAQQNTGRPRGVVLIEYEYLNSLWSAYTVVIQESK